MEQFDKTLSNQRLSQRKRWLLTGVALLVALAMFVAAAGDGSADAPSPPPDWFNQLANVASAAIGVLVLIPRTRGLGAWLAILSMLMSMVANITVDGVGYFWRVLPFNLGTIALSATLIFARRQPAQADDPRGLPR